MLAVGLFDMKGLAVQVVAGRWFGVFASFLIMAAAGASYVFGLYSPDIKAAHGYDQTTLSLLSFFKEVGANVGVLAGLINKLAPAWVVMLIGAILNFFGYFMIWLAVTHKIPTPPVWQMSLYIFIGANSQSFANTGSLVTCLKNFPESRGVVLRILKGYARLSGAIIAQLYHAFYEGDTKAFILLIGWLPAVISVAFLRTIRFLPSVSQPLELKVFYHFLSTSLALASFFMLMIIIQKITHFSQPVYGVSATVLFLFLPLAAIIIEEYKSFLARRLAVDVDHPVKDIIVTTTPETTTISDLTKSNRKGQIEIKWRQNIFGPLARGEDYTIVQALFSIDMIILFIACICGVGGTLTAIDNLGQIGASLKYPKNIISTFVTLVSIWNYGGRVFSGFVSEYYLRKFKFPRPLMLTLILLLSCVGYLLIAFDVKEGLYVAPVIIGFSFGAQWPLLFAIISDLFGLKYRSTLYSFCRGASLIGLYILNVKITGHLYDKEAKKQFAVLGIQRKEDQELSCIGGDCFRMSFILIATATFFAALMSLVLIARTWKFYKGDIYKRFQDAAETETETAEVPPENCVPPGGDNVREEVKDGN